MLSKKNFNECERNEWAIEALTVTSIDYYV
jgi:hypothetical protein